MLSEIDLRIRYSIYTAFAEGSVPLSTALASRLHVSQQQIHESYERLHAARAIVIDAHTREVWMAPPFSAKPTAFRVLAEGRAWSAPCAWDAFGIANLMGCDAALTTTCPDCGGPIVHRVERRALIDAHGVVHFLVPARSDGRTLGSPERRSGSSGLKNTCTPGRRRRRHRLARSCRPRISGSSRSTGTTAASRRTGSRGLASCHRNCSPMPDSRDRSGR